MSSSNIFAAYKDKKREKNKRSFENYIATTGIKVENKTIENASNIPLKCQSKHKHEALLNRLLNRQMAHRKKGRIGRNNANLRIMLYPFFAGIGIKGLSDVANILVLPNSQHLEQTISRHRSDICTTMIKISEREKREE